MNAKMLPKTKAVKESGRRSKLSNEEYGNRLSYIYDDNIINTEKYKNTRTKIMHYCKKHKIHCIGFPQSVLFGSTPCPECQKETFHTRRMDDINSIINRINEKYGDEYEIVPGQEYNGYKSKLWFKHYPNTTKEHLVYSRPSRIMADCACPVCSGTQISKGFNDCATIRPDITLLMTNEEDRYKYGPYSNQKVDFTCPYCKTVLNKNINQVSRDGYVRCPNCSDGITYPNKMIYNCLIQIDNLDFLEREYSPDWCNFIFRNNKRKGKYDIYFGYLGKKYIIEMDGGIGHGNKSMGGISPEESIYIDNQKDKLANEHNIKVIRINAYYPKDYEKYEFIKNNILLKLPTPKRCADP